MHPKVNALPQLYKANRSDMCNDSMSLSGTSGPFNIKAYLTSSLKQASLQLPRMTSRIRHSQLGFQERMYVQLDRTCTRQQRNEQQRCNAVLRGTCRSLTLHRSDTLGQAMSCTIFGWSMEELVVHLIIMLQSHVVGVISCRSHQSKSAAELAEPLSATESWAERGS